VRDLQGFSLMFPFTLHTCSLVQRDDRILQIWHMGFYLWSISR